MVKIFSFIFGLIILSVNGFAEENYTFKVGAILPLTGGLAEYGVAAKNGVELAREQHPSLFTNIKFVYEDSQWDPKTAVSAFNKLSYDYDVSLVFNWGNQTTEAVAPIAETRNIPLIGMTSDPAAVRGKTRLIRCINPAADFSKRLAGHLKQKGYKKLGVVMAQNTYLQGLFDGLRANLGDDQQITTVATFNPSEMDFRGAILKAKSQGFDAIGVFLISGQVSTFYRQLQDLHIGVPTFGTDFFESATEVKMANGAMEGAVFATLGITPIFESQYVAKYKNDYQIAHAGNAYDFAMMIGTLFNSEKERLSTEEILRKLHSYQSSLIGATGASKYRRTEDGDSYFEFPIQLKRVEKEHFIPIND